MSVHWPIIRSLLSRPGAVAAVDDRREWKSIEILAGACHIADALASASSSRTVGVMLPTSASAPMAMLAGWMLGKTVVPLNYLLKPDELQYVVDDCGADTIITANAMLEYMRHAGHERPPRVANLIAIDTLDFKRIPDLRWPSVRGVDAFGHSAGDLAALLYTSGTSGRPKGVMLTHRNLAVNVDQCMRWVNFTTADVLLGVLPQFHSFGLTVLSILPLSRGCKVVYAARFSPNQMIKLIRRHRPTAFIGIPSMYNALLSVKDAGPDDFASLKYTVSGSEPLPAAVAEAFRQRFGVTINEGYGLTETAPVTNWCRPWEYRPRSVGRALPDVLERIVDPATERTLGPNIDGEVRIKGPNVTPGYFNLPEDSGRSFDDQGYLRTGDMGRMDDDGHLYITGRIKEMLIVAGENVFPREIEEVLEKHPSVAASGIVGVTDPLRGELPLAFVELREGAEAPTESELRAWCRERLAGYKVPTGVRMMDRLPRSPTGKVLRRELRRIAEGPETAKPKA